MIMKTSMMPGTRGRMIEENTPARMKRFLWEFILWKDSIVLCFRSEKCRVTKIGSSVDLQAALYCRRGR